MNEVSIIINGVRYDAVDTPIEIESPYTCEDCDIFKISNPTIMHPFPICCDKPHSKIGIACADKFDEGYFRIYKKIEE